MPHKRWTRADIDAMTAALDAGESVRGLARKHGVTLKRIQTLFKEHTGCSPTEWLKRQRAESDRTAKAATVLSVSTADQAAELFGEGSRQWCAVKGAEREAQSKDPCVPPPPKQSGLRTTLVIPDTHRPYHDPAAFAVALEVAREIRPHRVVIIGDWQDCYSASRCSCAMN
jgi:hypothetical protein